MDYTSLVATKTADANSIRAWINWDVAPSEAILSEAEALIYKSLSIAQMEKLDTGTISDGDTSLELPEDFMRPKSFRRIGMTAGEITVLDRQHFEERLALDENGEYQRWPPEVCTIYGDPITAYFESAADQDIDYRLLYYARPEALSETNTTNWLTREYPFLVRATCLYMGFLHRKELQSASVWANISSQLIQAANGYGDMQEALVQLEFFSKQRGE